MATRKPTLFQQAQKEIKRIKRAVSRIEKRGYVFGKIPGINKKSYSRKDVEKLKNLKAKDLYKYATAFGLRGEVYRERERIRAAQKAAQTRKSRQSLKDWLKDWVDTDKEYDKDNKFHWVSGPSSAYKPPSISGTVIDMFRDRKKWRWNDIYYNKFMQIVDDAINRLGRDAVADIIEDMNLAGFTVVIQSHYKPADFYPDYSDLFDYFSVDESEMNAKDAEDNEVPPGWEDDSEDDYWEGI